MGPFIKKAFCCKWRDKWFCEAFGLNTNVIYTNKIQNCTDFTEQECTRFRFEFDDMGKVDGISRRCIKCLWGLSLPTHERGWGIKLCNLEMEHTSDAYWKLHIQMYPGKSEAQAGALFYSLSNKCSWLNHLAAWAMIKGLIWENFFFCSLLLYLSVRPLEDFTWLCMHWSR